MTEAEAPPDLDLARRLVADQFPQWAHLQVREVEHSGWDNRTFRLGDEMSIRLPRSRHYREQVAKEQRWLPVLGPQLPVPIPRPVAQGVPGPGYPYDWSVYAWIDGLRRTWSGWMTWSVSLGGWASSWWRSGTVTRRTARCPVSTTGGEAVPSTSISRKRGQR